MKQLQKHMKEAKSLPPVGSDAIFFSNATYQVGVSDPSKSEMQWPFVHLGEKGELVDGFCSCSEGDEAGCIHLAKAYLVCARPEVGLPLHKAFDHSLFKVLGLHWFRLGKFTFKESQLRCGPVSVSATAKCERDFLSEIVEKSGEFEETSLKFSGLSPEEIESYRRGCSSEALAYALSLWSDIAKWLFIKKEFGELSEMKIAYDSAQMPRAATFLFTGLEVTCPIEKEEISLWIDHLADFPSPLFVKNLAHLDAARLDRGALVLERSGDTPQGLIEGPGYLYEPKKGFYKTQKKTERVEKKELEVFLDERAGEIAPFFTVEKEPRTCKHALAFDEKNRLHILPYLFEAGDLTTGASFLLDHWAYIDGRGFFAIEPPRFGGERIVRTENVGEFLMDQRFWLQDYPGFAVHLFQLDTDWSFRVEGSGALKFFQQFVETPRETIDLGEWVYVRGEGFFQKKGSSFYHTLSKQNHIAKEQVGDFIAANEDELSAVSHFFSSNSPVEKRALNIFLSSDGSITVDPVLKLVEGAKESDLAFYGAYVYWKDRGFSALYDSALPFGFEQKKRIAPGRVHRFLTSELARLRPFILEISPELERVKEFRFALTHFEQSRTARPWRARLEIIGEGWRLLLSELAKAKNASKEVFFSSHGFFDLTDERFEWLSYLGEKSIHGDLFRMTTVEMLRLMAYSFETDLLSEASRRVYEGLTALKARRRPNLDGLMSELRSYQRVGVEWLWSLHEYSLSGMLCDDMGLGKTHQAMALLCAIANKKRTKPLSAVIVCPTSVIYHWQDQLERFLPRLKVYVYHGSGRKIEEFKRGYDLLLTSYGILRRGDAHLRRLRFDLAIFDEMQIAKNYHSQTHEALTKIKTGMVLGLSGTPLENDLEELRALFDIVLPSYLPGESHFRKFFAQPIEKMQNKERRDLLRRLIQPFILRRRKSEVLQDLPKKIEQNAFADMEDEQRALYVQTAEHYHAELRRYITSGAKGAIPFTSVLALLTKLKMICSHPALFLGDVEGYKNYPCGKWRLFTELLREARSSSQKVVVFTQYLGMIDILKAYLREQGIGFASIQGATVNRQKELERFANEPSCEVFVGSLRAVGLGVNLSSGSCVIHYDRWWNPAWENQATDRVHRIGQRRGVQVFKLITKHSIEEKIDEIIQRKTRLLDIVDFKEGEDILGTFTKEDWMELVDTLKASHRY